MKARRLVITALAEDDLAEIWWHIALDDAAAADSFVDELHARCRLLGETPDAGRARPDLAPEVRSFPYARYVILYRHRPDVVEILRVVSGYRDLHLLL
jgi:toxin ParE1/3/4